MSGDFTLPLADATLAGEFRGGAADGAHPPAILLHGFGGTRGTWDLLWAALPPDRAALRYDQRGFGASAAGDAKFSHADDLLRLMDARGIARADLVGLSQGGALAVHFALEQPERVRRLALVSPALMGWEWSPEWREAWRAIARLARAGDLAGARRQWWQHPLFAATRASPAADTLRAEIEAFAGRQWIADPQRAVLADVERLHRLRARTLLLSGERDVADFRLIADVLAASVPDIERRDLAGGHMLHLELPEAVNAAVTGFLAAP